MEERRSTGDEGCTEVLRLNVHAPALLEQERAWLVRGMGGPFLGRLNSGVHSAQHAPLYPRHTGHEKRSRYLSSFGGRTAYWYCCTRLLATSLLHSHDAELPHAEPRGVHAPALVNGLLEVRKEAKNLLLFRDVVRNAAPLPRTAGYARTRSAGPRALPVPT